MSITAKSIVQLQRLAKGSTEAAAAIAHRSAEIIAAKAKQLAPERTGFLKSRIIATPAIKTSQGAESAVVVDCDYADEQEFGSDHNEAQPFLRPAVESEYDRVVREAMEIAASYEREALQ